MAMCLLQHYWKSFLKEPSGWENFVINSPICGRNNTNSAQTLTENWRIISKLILHGQSHYDERKTRPNSFMNLKVIVNHTQQYGKIIMSYE